MKILNGLLEDFCDGEVVKNHPLFSTDPQALQIVAYYDELEVCNPLGTQLKLLVRHCVDHKYFTTQEYNRRIVFFDYGSSEMDKKPTIITRDILRSDDKKFHLSSSQTLLLCRILPILVGECVPEVDPNWKCFILLLKIIDIVNCPVITKGQGAILQLLIEEHHTAFKTLYSESSIIPNFTSWSIIPIS